jgi:retinol dehydrogenase-12
MNKLLVTVPTVTAAYLVLRRWARGGMVPDECLKRSLVGTAIVTGGAGGIGRETSIQLAKQGCNVIVAARDSTKTRDAMVEMKRQLGQNADKLDFMPLDLSSLKDVGRFCSEWNDKPLHLLINSAGIMALPNREESVDGHELQMATNVLGHHLLTRRLLPSLIATAKRDYKPDEPAPVRIINVASRAHRAGNINWQDFENTQDYSGFKVYGDTKLGNIMHTNYLASTILPQELGVSEEEARRYITANSIHPGLVRTGIARYALQLPKFLETILFGIAGIFFKTPWEGAQTTLYLALCRTGGTESGGYFADCKREDNKPRTRTSGLMDKQQQSRRQSEWKLFWDKCEELTQSY